MGEEVIPLPHAPYPQETYVAVETTDGNIEINSTDDTTVETLTQSELDALFKKKPA